MYFLTREGSILCWITRCRSVASNLARRNARSLHNVLGAVLVLLEDSAILAQHDAAPKASVQRGTVHDDGVLDVIAGVRHHSHCRVLPRPQLVKPDQLYRLCSQQRTAQAPYLKSCGSCSTQTCHQTTSTCMCPWERLCKPKWTDSWHE